MSESRRMSDSSNMEKDIENRDEICSSPAFSMISETSKHVDIPVSELLDETLAYVDLMNCDDLLEEGPCPRPHSPMSGSWCSDSDSDISEIFTSFDQNVDDEITKVCQSFLWPENLEKESDESGDEAWTSQTRSSSRLAMKSEESTRPASTASSYSTSIAITKAAEVLIYQSNEPAKTLEDTEPVKKLEDTEPVKKLEDTEPVKISETSEHVDIPVSKLLDETLAYVDLMNCDDLLEEGPCPRPHSPMSGSWCSDSDSDISEIFTSFDQNVDDEITKVCQSFLWPENLEKESDEFGDGAWTSQTRSSSRLTMKSEESTRPASTASSSSTSIAITKAAEVLIYPSNDTAKTLENTEPVKKLKDTEPVKKLEDTEPVKTLEDTEPVKTLEDTEPVKTLEDTEPVKKLEDTEPVKISETSEHVDIPVSELLDETLAYVDLMNCDDLLEEGPCPRPHSLMSCSWCSDSDSDVSEIFTSFDQNVDDEITKVCQSFLWPENLEKESDEFGDGAWTSQTRSSSRLAMKSEESTRPASTASSYSTSIAITKAAEVLIYQSNEPAKTLEDTEPVKTLEDTEPVKTLEATEPVKTLEDTEPVKKLEDTEPVKTLKVIEPVKTPETSPLQLVEQEEGVPPMPMIITVVPASPSTSSLPPAHQVDEIPQSQNPLLAEPDLNKIKSPFSHEDKEAAGDWQLVLNSSTITVLIRRFFQSLSEEQWREVGEGIYNPDVKEHLTDMCTDVLTFISKSVAQKVLHTIHEGQSHMALKTSLSSAPLTELFGITEPNMQKSLKSSLSQAFSHVVGADNPGRISTKFTEAMAGVIIDEVNSILSVALQASHEGGSSSITAADSCLVSKDRAAKKILEGAIITMKSFITGRSTAVKRNNGFGHERKVETMRGGCKGKKKSHWKRCFKRWQRKTVQPAPLEHFYKAVGSVSTDLTFFSTGDRKQVSLCSQETSSTTSKPKSTPLELVDYIENEDQAPEDARIPVSSLSATSLIPLNQESVEVPQSNKPEEPPLANSMTDEFQEEMRKSLSYQSTGCDKDDDKTSSQSFVDQSQPDSECSRKKKVDVEETKAKQSSRFSRFLCNIFSKNEKKKKAKAENLSEQPRFWMKLLSCSSCSCCLDK